MVNDIISAYDDAMNKNLSVTDDASVAEAFGLSVQTVEGSYANIKLTTPEDIWMGEAILKRG
jgi:2-C-methyl-D-erythritol 4-phosphate cytidylyltransferase